MVWSIYRLRYWNDPVIKNDTYPIVCIVVNYGSCVYNGNGRSPPWSPICCGNHVFKPRPLFMAGGDDVRKMICECLKYLVMKSRMFQYQIIPINGSLQHFGTVVNGIVLFQLTRGSDPEIDGWYEIHESLIIIYNVHYVFAPFPECLAPESVSHRGTFFYHDGHNFADTACTYFTLKSKSGTVNAWQCMT